MTTTIVQLKAVGESLRMRVESAELVPVGKYPEYAFIGAEVGERAAVELRVPRKSADRQLARLNLTLADTVGLILAFSRGANAADASKPYWNIDVKGNGAAGTGGPATAGAAGVAHKGASGMNASATTQPDTPEKPHGYVLYKQISQRVLADMPEMYGAAGISLTAEAAAAITATIFIQASKH